MTGSSNLFSRNAPIYTATTMAQIDRSCQRDFAIPGQWLMEQAAMALVAVLRSRYRRRLAACRVESNRRVATIATEAARSAADSADRTAPAGPVVLCLCGSGNNGGDAAAVARLLHCRGVAVVCVYAAPTERTALAAEQRAACRALSIPVLEATDPSVAACFSRAALIVDGLLGTGGRGIAARGNSDSSNSDSGNAGGELATLIGRANAAAAPTIAVDVPSGVFAGYQRNRPAITADTTVCIGALKDTCLVGDGRERAGRVVVRSLSFPPALFVRIPAVAHRASARDLQRLVPALPATSFKNRRGRVGIMAGAPGTWGAARLCAQAAARSRAGLVEWLVAEPTQPPGGDCATAGCAAAAPGGTAAAAAAAATLPAAIIVRGIDLGQFDPGRDMPDDCRCLVVGPGWGTGIGHRDMVGRLARQPIPVVCDAAALRILAEMVAVGPIVFASEWILTPHPGELSTLAHAVGRATDANGPGAALPGEESDQPILVGQARAVARYCRAVVVVKSASTIIVAADGPYVVVDGMLPALGTAGSGDVLAGIIGGLRAGGLNAFDAAAAGVLVHLRAGRRAYQVDGLFIADDLLRHISGVLGRNDRSGRRRGAS